MLRFSFYKITTVERMTGTLEAKQHIYQTANAEWQAETRSWSKLGSRRTGAKEICARDILEIVLMEMRHISFLVLRQANELRIASKYVIGINEWIGRK